MKIILEDRKFIWQESELREFRKMWKRGDNLKTMAKCLDCKEINIALVVIDQAERKNIEPRVTGLLGVE